MKVYHASSVVVDCPDTLHSRSFLDFGPGFYVTRIEQQAIDYGQRFIRRGKDAWLNTYELSENLKDCKVLSFDAYDESWLDFVSECRAGRIFSDWWSVRMQRPNKTPNIDIQRGGHHISVGQSSFSYLEPPCHSSSL